VVSVFAGSPAHRAGVKVGDRILAIGARKLEHESTDIAGGLLDLKPGPVVLTLNRGGTALTVTINREPLACLLEVAPEIRRGIWMTQIDRLRKLNAVLREVAGSPTVGALELDALSREGTERYKDYKALSEMLDFSINQTIQSKCQGMRE
jgi:C-terminal processing protease CtpA/Prc